MASIDESVWHSADYVIVGAGSAGCVLAARLTENPAIKVVLIEAGASDTSPIIHMPPGYARAIGNPSFDWVFQAGPEPGLGGKTLPYARGKVIGGSSSINGLAWVWGARADYDAWRDLGCVGWGYDDVVPYLRRTERFAEDWPGRGHEGQVPVELNPGFHPPMRRLLEAAEQAGLPTLRDYNAVEAPIGLARFQLNLAGGRRMSAAATYLKPALGRANLVVLTNVSVLDVVVENGAATGVRVRAEGTTKVVQANAEVILSAGAVGSPLLLEGSGIGDPGRLSKLGIPVRCASKDVGENVRDHWLTMLNYQLKDIKSFNQSGTGWRGALAMLRYLTTRTGLLSGTPTELNGYARVDLSPGPADVQLFAAPMTYKYVTNKSGASVVKLDKEPGMGFGLYVCRPRATGHVHLKDREGRIDFVAGFLDHEYDRAVTAAGLKLCRRIMSQPAIARHVVAESAPGPDAASDEDLLEFARTGGMPGFHLVSSCRMGSDPDSVVDLELRVRGMRRLRVVDASVMPDIIGANTHAPTLMIAEKAAEMIRQ